MHSGSVDGTAAAGNDFTGHEGSVIFAAYHFLLHWSDALETEIHAMMQDMSVAK